MYKNEGFVRCFPSNPIGSRYENGAFVRCFLPIRIVQDVKTKLSCEAFLQMSKLEDVTTSLRRSSSNAESVSTYTKHNSTASSKKRENHLEPSVPLRAHFETRPATPAPVAHACLLFTAPEAPFTRKKHNVSCKS